MDLDKFIGRFKDFSKGGEIFRKIVLGQLEKICSEDKDHLVSFLESTYEKGIEGVVWYRDDIPIYKMPVQMFKDKRWRFE